MSLPISVFTTKLIPSAASKSTRRCTTFLSSFIVGIPYVSSPPMRSLRSNTVTVCPALLSCAAAASPAGPEPTIAIFLPVRFSGGLGTTQPSSKPLSTIASSIVLMVTGCPIRPTVQEPSHGAGQILPVNSGKLFVLCRRSSASFQSPRYTKLFHSGIKLCTGQPEVPPAISIPVWQ
ncbi:hypothetical protein D3C75_684050 [compost metagenome]